MSDSRFEELETRLAFQESALVSLSDQVYAQERDLDELKVQLRHLSRSLRSAQDEGRAGPRGGDHEVPPHY